MEFVHTVVQELTGLRLPDRGDYPLMSDEARGISAYLVADPTPYCSDPDLSVAVGNMLLRAIAGGGPEGTPEERLAGEVQLARDGREEAGFASTYLVVIRRGETSEFEGGQEREIDGVVLRVGGTPKQGIGHDTKRVAASLALALAIETDHPVTVKPYADALLYDRGDGKKIVAKRFESSANATVWRSYEPENTEAVSATFAELVDLDELSRVFNLFLASLESSADRLRSFQSGWAALEIFVNKVFASYEARVSAEFQENSGEEHPWDRLLQDKYSLMDKFLLIATYLTLGDVGDDEEVFRAAKKKRDHLYHGQDVDERHLPAESVHGLLKKYIHLHSRMISGESGLGGS